MMPHEMIDSSRSMRRTPWEIGFDSRTSRTIDVLDATEPSGAAPPCACMSKAITGLPSVRKTGLRGTAVRRWDSANAELYHVVKTAVKPMLRLEFSRFPHAPLPAHPTPGGYRLG